MHPPFGVLLLLQDLLGVKCLMILQVIAALASLPNDFLGKGVSIIRVREVQHHTLTAHHKNLEGGLATKPPASLELLDV